MATEPCVWCGGNAAPGSTCPKSLPCPTCHARQGTHCRRPSGHAASELHAERIAAAERLDAERILTYDSPAATYTPTEDDRADARDYIRSVGGNPNDEKQVETVATVHGEDRAMREAWSVRV